MKINISWKFAKLKWREINLQCWCTITELEIKLTSAVVLILLHGLMWTGTTRCCLYIDKYIYSNCEMQLGFNFFILLFYTNKMSKSTQTTTIVCTYIKGELPPLHAAMQLWASGSTRWLGLHWFCFLYSFFLWNSKYFPDSMPRNQRCKLSWTKARSWVWQGATVGACPGPKSCGSGTNAGPCPAGKMDEGQCGGRVCLPGHCVGGGSH